MMQLLQFLRTELAPRPGRLADTLRITLFTLVVIILTEVFQTPLPAYSAFIVFFVSKEERASTFLTAIIVTLSASVAVLLAVAIYMISAGEPGLRLPLMALVVFCGMFFSRASSLGLAAFAIGFLVTLSLTLIDFLQPTPPIPLAQLLTKSVLWLWGIIMLPVAIVIFGNILSGRDPAQLFIQGVIERLELAGRLLIEPTANLYERQKVVAAIPMKAESSDPRVVAQVGRLLTLLTEWKAVKTSSPELLSVASDCGAFLHSMAQSFKAQKAPQFIPLHLNQCIKKMASSGILNERKEALLLATIIDIVERLSQILEKPLVHKKLPRKLLVPEAFSNPEYVHYALKTTLAIFIAYITYNMVDWPGIRTCLITCFFVALGTVGETVHKMILRLSGAIIGGILGLGTVIFIMPYLTTITGLSIIVAAVTFCAAWVATSSERLAYAGLQIALAFFLCLLVGYAPQIELTPARDRVVGVLFGNIIIFVVFTLIWPTRAIVQAKRSLAMALGRTVDLAEDDPFLEFNAALTRARNFATLDPLEPLNEKSRKERMDPSWIEAVQELAGPLILLSKMDSLLPDLGKGRVWLLAYADWCHILVQRLNELSALTQKQLYQNEKIPAGEAV